MIDHGHFVHIGLRGTVEFTFDRKGNGVWYAYLNQEGFGNPRLFKGERAYQRAVEYVRNNGKILQGG